MRGKPYRIKVTDGKKTKFFNSCSDASTYYYPHREASYLTTAKMHSTDKHYHDDVLGLDFYKMPSGGRTKNQRKYRVVYGNGLEERYDSRKELLESVDVGVGAFDRQIRHFGSYKSSELQIFPIL